MACFSVLAYLCVLDCLSVLACFCVLAYFSNLACLSVLAYLSYLACLSVLAYRKIPKISPGAYIFQRPFLRGLFLEGLMFGGAYARRKICV